VLTEAGAGDPEAAQRRLTALEPLPLLDVTDAAIALAAALITGQALPAQAAQDALHLAIACVHGMEYLLTWNCTHLANARLRSRIEQVCREAGYVPPIICTPEELEGLGKFFQAQQATAHRVVVTRAPRRVPEAVRGPTPTSDQA
jgi:hypothetical protein